MTATPDPVQIIRAADLPAVQVCPGVTQRNFPSSDHLIGWILDFEPGAEWPEATPHPTEERYYVLSGEIIDNGERLPAGTYVIFAPGTTHRPRTDVGAQLLGVNVRPS